MKTEDSNKLFLLDYYKSIVKVNDGYVLERVFEEDESSTAFCPNYRLLIFPNHSYANTRLRTVTEFFHPLIPATPVLGYPLS